MYYECTYFDENIILPGIPTVNKHQRPRLRKNMKYLLSYYIITCYLLIRGASLYHNRLPQAALGPVFSSLGPLTPAVSALYLFQLHVCILSIIICQIGLFMYQRNCRLENVRQEIYAKNWSQGYCVQTTLNTRFALLSLATCNSASTLRVF